VVAVAKTMNEFATVNLVSKETKKKFKQVPQDEVLNKRLGFFAE
jgi:hypothetical protein